MQYITELLEFRTYLNGILRECLENFYSNEPHFVNEVYARVEKGRKIRSFLFWKIALALNPNVSLTTLGDVCLTIEMPHAASVLVDDILDGDDIRHGYSPSETVLGAPLSSLISHQLCADAFSISTKYPGLFGILLETYRKTVVGELYDVFAIHPIEEWACTGYSDRVSQKTSSLFEYSLRAAAVIADWDEAVHSLQLLGKAFGRLYQMSNDYHDLQKTNLSKRHRQVKAWPMTFSFPLALYLARFGMEDIKSHLDKRLLSFGEWKSLLGKIWSSEIQEEARLELQNAHRDVTTLIRNALLPLDVKQQIDALAETVLREEFWYHDIREEQPRYQPSTLASSSIEGL